MVTNAREPAFLASAGLMPGGVSIHISNALTRAATIASDTTQQLRVAAEVGALHSKQTPAIGMSASAECLVCVCYIVYAQVPCSLWHFPCCILISEQNRTGRTVSCKRASIQVQILACLKRKTGAASTASRSSQGWALLSDSWQAHHRASARRYIGICPFASF